ncbi:hypothetical protein GTA08_BOTSDO13584 [Neofusicoccum parvum]|nr:hypothetical protein GTA08_BOTSDO13584 [Neofusicoccum parvum]
MLDIFSDLPLQANAHDQHAGKSLYTFPEKRTQEASAVTTTVDDPACGSEPPLKQEKRLLMRSDDTEEPDANPDANQDPNQAADAPADAPTDADPAISADKTDVLASIDDRRYRVQLAGEGLGISKERPSIIKVVLPNGVSPSDEELISGSLEKGTGKKVVNISKETAMPQFKKRSVNTDGLAEARPVERRGVFSWLIDKFDILEDSSGEEYNPKGYRKLREKPPRKRRMKKLRMRRQTGNVDDSQLQDVAVQSNEHTVSTRKGLQKPERRSAHLQDKRELDEDGDDEDEDDEDAIKLVTEPSSKTHDDMDFRIAHFQLPDHMGGRCGPSGAWRDACPEGYFRMLADANTSSVIVPAVGITIMAGVGVIVSAMVWYYYRRKLSRMSRRETAGRTGATAELELGEKV